MVQSVASCPTLFVPPNAHFLDLSYNTAKFAIEIMPLRRHTACFYTQMDAEAGNSLR